MLSVPSIPSDCPHWNYKNSPDWDATLLRWYVTLNSRVAAFSRDIVEFLTDTRPTHKEVFLPLTVTGYECYAGEYRGSTSCRCLRNYPIFIGRHEGSHPHHVQAHMAKFAIMAASAFQSLKTQIEGLDAAKKLRLIAERAAEVFVAFLTIHPYADGNGHMARLIILLWMFYFGFKVQDFTWHPRPYSSLQYDDLIQQHRDGNTKPLVALFIMQIRPLPDPPTV